MKTLLLVLLSVSSLSVKALGMDKCETEALEMAELLDEVTQETYDGIDVAPAQTVQLKSVNPHFSNFIRYEWEVSFRHSSDDGEAWFNIYTLAFNETTQGECKLVSYKYGFEYDEGFLFEE